MICMRCTSDWNENAFKLLLIGFKNTRTKRLRMRKVSIFKIAVTNANFTTRTFFFS